jgi:nucleotide-binding universal stress UspA family protein
MLPFKTILHPTDFSTPSEYAFQVACSLARDHNAQLIVLHAVPPATADYGGLAPYETPAGYRRQLWDEVRRLTGLEPYIRELNIKSELVDGDPVRVILSRAGELGCDLIVMGTHGRRGLSRLLMGSVAEGVLRRAPCPVLTVKGPPAQPAAVAAGEQSAAEV